MFSKVLRARIATQLDKQQRADKSGFRADFGTDDHLFSITALAELAWQGPTALWLECWISRRFLIAFSMSYCGKLYKSKEAKKATSMS